MLFKNILKSEYLFHMYIFPGELLPHLERDLFSSAGYLPSIYGKVINVFIAGDIAVCFTGWHLIVISTR